MSYLMTRPVEEAAILDERRHSKPSIGITKDGCVLAMMIRSQIKPSDSLATLRSKGHHLLFLLMTLKDRCKKHGTVGDCCPMKSGAI